MWNEMSDTPRTEERRRAILECSVVTESFYYMYGWAQELERELAAKNVECDLLRDWIGQFIECPCCGEKRKCWDECEHKNLCPVEYQRMEYAREALAESEMKGE